MKVDEKTCRLIAHLEHLIGKECYNPNSYDGWNDIEGCDFRYPVSVPNGKGEYKKVKSLIDAKDVSSETIPYIKYKFGSNELFIGKGIINVLNYLEEQYGFNFNDLAR